MGAETLLKIWRLISNSKVSKGGGRGVEGVTKSGLWGKVTVPAVPIVVPPSPFPSLGESGGGRTADGVAGRGSVDGGRARGGSWGGMGEARRDVAVPVGRNSWADQMSELSLSGRDSLPQEGGRNARVRRAVRISSLVAQEVSVGGGGV